MPSYAPMSTKGVALEEVTLALIAKGAVELALLPSPGFYSHLFVVWKTLGSWCPAIKVSHLNRFLASSHFKMETIQSVLLSVRPGDWMVSIDLNEAYFAGPCSSRLSQVSAVCGFWLGVSIPCSLLRSCLGPSGLHPGHGSSFVDPALHGYLSSSLPGRLAGPVFFLGGCSSRPPGGPRSVLGAWDCGESREVQLCPVPEGSVSGDDPGLPVFCGFSVTGSVRQAAISRLRISVLLSAARILLAVSSRHPVPSCTRGQASHAVSSVSAPPNLESRGRLGSCSLDSLLSPRPPLVVRRVSSGSRGLSHRSPRTSTFGPTPWMWAGEFTWVRMWFPAFGPTTRLAFPSMPESF